MPDVAMTDEEFFTAAPTANQSSPPPALISDPNAPAGGVTNRNAPPPLFERERELRQLGQREGVPFHQGLPIISDIGLKAQQTPQEQVRYLARQYGAENVRMNELGEPVVSIKGEDYVVDPHKLNLNSLTGLAAYAPETLLSAAAIAAGGSKAGIVNQALRGALGAALGRAGKEVVGQELQGEPVDLNEIANRSAAQVLPDTMGGIAIGGLVKAGQAFKGLIEGKGLPNPLANMKFLKPLFSPANPELTGEGVAAAQRLAAKTGIPAKLSPAESTGIPLLAQLETRQENVAAGAGIGIKAQAERDQVSRDWQNWAIDPKTLGTDEEVAKRGLGVLRSTVEPFEKDVALAKFAAEAQQRGDTRLLQSMRAQGEANQQAKIITDMNVGQLPASGAPMTEAGDLVRNRVVAMRDAEKQGLNDRYEAFFDNPETMDPTIKGTSLKNSIDQTLKELPGVTKLVQEDAGVTGFPPQRIVSERLQKVPVETPIRPRLEELSGKLANGKVSINDLKQIRTDVGDAIKAGEAVPGVKAGRLKQLYSQLSDAIDEGLDQIGNPALKQEWEGLTQDYEKFATKFSEKTLAPLFKEADQPGIGNTSFAQGVMASPDKYVALRTFLGGNSSELAAFQKTARLRVFQESLADGSSTALDGGKLIRELSQMQSSNPQLFQDAFGNNGAQFIKAAKVLSTFQHNLPAEETEALLNPANRATPNALSNLQQAERRLKDEFTNGALNDWLNGKRGDVDLDKLVRFLPNYKLSEVRDIMQRLATDPEVTEQWQRKTMLSLFQEARRNPSPADVLQILKSGGTGGDVLSGSALATALGRGDQFEKYKAILSPEQFEFVTDMAKRELLREEKRRVGGGTGIFAKGDVATGVLDALTPGRTGSKRLMADLSTFARDKIAAVILASPKLSSYLSAAHQLDDIPHLMGAVIASEPFVRGMLQEFRNPGDAYKAMATLKATYGAGQPTPTNNAPAMSDAEFFQGIQR